MDNPLPVIPGLTIEGMLGSGGRPYFSCVAMPEKGGTVTSRMVVNG